MASLLEGDYARLIIGAQSEVGTRLSTWLGVTRRCEKTVLHEDTPLEAGIVAYEREAAKIEAENPRPGLVMWTDGSRQDNGACGYSVVWGKGCHYWRGVKTHMGFNQGIRCRMRGDCEGAGPGGRAMEATREGHDLDRCTGRRHMYADMRGGPWLKSRPRSRSDGA